MFVPDAVRRETVDEAPALPDAMAIRANVAAGAVVVLPPTRDRTTGDTALLATFNRKDFDAIATDDRRLIREIRSLGAPYLVPCTLLVVMAAEGTMRRMEAISALESLRPYVSEEEYAAAMLCVEGRRP